MLTTNNNKFKFMINVYYITEYILISVVEDVLQYII